MWSGSALPLVEAQGSLSSCEIHASPPPHPCKALVLLLAACLGCFLGSVHFQVAHFSFLPKEGWGIGNPRFGTQWHDCPAWCMGRVKVMCVCPEEHESQNTWTKIKGHTVKKQRQASCWGQWFGSSQMGQGGMRRPRGQWWREGRRSGRHPSHMYPANTAKTRIISGSCPATYSLCYLGRVPHLSGLLLLHLQDSL